MDSLHEKPDVCTSGHPSKTNASATRRRGVLLINLGTPDAPEPAAVKRYLAEFLSDPAVIQLPRGLGWMNRLLGHMIASFRAKKSAALYRRIWTERGSPLGSITEAQTAALAEALPSGWQAFYAMRYGRPAIRTVLAEIARAGVEELVVVPVYPQFSGTTTGTAVKELYAALRKDNHHFSVTVRNSWFDDGGYIYAQAKLIHEYATAHSLTPSDTRLVFSVHGLPVSYVERGDPYPDQVRRSMELITERLGWPADRTSMGYQSRMGPAKWLEPALDHLMGELVTGGDKRLLICPISFTADCLETLEEIDVRYREQVESAGGEMFLCPALNDHGLFIDAIKELVIRGPRPVAPSSHKNAPLLGDPAQKHGTVHRDTDALVLLGVSKGNVVGSGLGPPLTYSTEEGLCKIKKSQCAIVPLLRDVCEEHDISEAFVWNTCSRFEFYGWLGENARNGHREHTIAAVRQRMFDGDAGEEMNVNVRFGADAWHHLMRTASGLNSGLPGDKDILEQLATAQRVAERAGTAGCMTKRLIDDAMRVERCVRERTRWGQFDPGYCYASMTGLIEKTGVTLPDSRCAVFGGSTTSRSVLLTLAGRFDVPTRMLSLVYRGHGSGQMKLLRKAIGNGKRVRVGSYGETAAVDAILESDVVVFGIDADEPVLRAESIQDRRDFTKRPLLVIDFNTFGSTNGLESIEGVTVIDAAALDAEVVAFGRTMCSSPDFPEAVREAEELIVADSPRHQCRVAVEPTIDVCEACGRPKTGQCRGPQAFAAGSSLS